MAYALCFIKSQINQNTLETTGVSIREDSGPAVESHELEISLATY